MKQLIFSLVLIFWSVIILGQNVGINTNVPTEDLHIRSSETKTAIRIDSKKSVENGVNYFTATGTPTSISNFVFNPSYIDWTDLDASKLVDSDDNHLNGPLLNIYPDVANNARIYFDFDPVIPSTANISNVTLHAEWKRNGTAAGELRIFNIIMRQSINNMPLVNFGYYTRITSSTDIDVALPYKSIINPLTPDMLNLNDIYIGLVSLHSVTGGTSRLEIDKIWLEIEYNLPADGTENVFWTTGVKEGSFQITNSEDLNSNDFLTISENGITELKSLKILQNAGPNKVLTSNEDGLASWSDLPVQSEVLWINNSDTATYASGPLQINNAVGQAALVFDKGATQLNNGTKMIETRNKSIDIVLDADANQNNEILSIYRDSLPYLLENPVIRFNLDGGSSWINTSGDVVIGSEEIAAGLVQDTLFFFKPAKGAMRSGILMNSNNWSPENIGLGSFATGRSTRASGNVSAAFGDNTYALGFAASTFGDNTIAKGYSTTAIGIYNDSILTTTETAVNSTTPLFIIGNGDNDANRSNALVVNKNGRIGIGINTPGHPIQHGNGAFLTSDGTWTNASDRRLKSKIKPIPYGLKEVLMLSPTTYIMNASGEKHVGFIAQDLKAIIPEVVNGTEGDIHKGETLGVAYGNLVAVLTKAIQDLSATVDEQSKQLRQNKEHINSLEEKLRQMNELETRLSSLENLLSSPKESHD